MLKHNLSKIAKQKPKHTMEYWIVESVYSFPAKRNMSSYISNTFNHLKEMFAESRIHDGYQSLFFAINTFNSKESYIKEKKVEGNLWIEVHQFVLIKATFDKLGNNLNRIILCVRRFDDQSEEKILNYFGKTEVLRINREINQTTHIIYKIAVMISKNNLTVIDASERDPLLDERTLFHYTEAAGTSKYDIEVGIEHDGLIAGIFMRMDCPEDFVAAIIKTNELNSYFLNRNIFIKDKSIFYESICVCQNDPNKIKQELFESLEFIIAELSDFQNAPSYL